MLESTTLPSTLTQEKCTSHRSSFLKQMNLPMILTIGRLRLPTRSHTSCYSKQQVLQSSVFWQIVYPEHYYSLTWDPSLSPITKCLDLEVQSHQQAVKRCFAPPGSVNRDLFTPPIGVKHPSDNTVHISNGNCRPASNSSSSVITASNSK